MIFLNKNREKVEGVSPEWDKFTICVVHPFNESTTFHWFHKKNKDWYTYEAKGNFSYAGVYGGMPIMDIFRKSEGRKIETKKIEDLLKTFDYSHINMEFPLEYANGVAIRKGLVKTIAYVVFIEGENDGRYATNYIRNIHARDIHKNNIGISQDLKTLRDQRVDNIQDAITKTQQQKESLEVRRASTILRVFHEIRMEVVLVKDDPGDYDPNTNAFFKEMEEDGTFMLVKSSHPKKDKYYYAIALREKCLTKKGKVKKRLPKDALIVKDIDLNLDFSKDPIFQTSRIINLF